VDKGFYLPQQIGKNLIDTTKNAIETSSLNLGLFLDKYILWYNENEKMNTDPTVQVSFLRKTAKSPQEVKKLLDSALSGRKFKEKILKNEKLSVPFKTLSRKHYESYKQRVDNLLKDLRQMGYSVVHAEPSLNWRLLVNLGSSSVYETSLLIHRNYSIPFIPGSAVKGVTNHHTIMLKEDGKITDEEYIRIFGDQNKKGDVIFFDALPVIEKTRDFIVLDVMNVHYGDYYRDESHKTPPGDWMNPNPVFFLAVEKGTKFKFTVASKDKNLANNAMNLLKDAITKLGIGAKTSASYGYFESV